jgi:hypothetical protein
MHGWHTPTKVRQALTNPGGGRSWAPNRMARTGTTAASFPQTQDRVARLRRSSATRLAKTPREARNARFASSRRTPLPTLVLASFERLNIQ